MATKRKPLAERVTWRDYGKYLATTWISDVECSVQKIDNKWHLASNVLPRIGVGEYRFLKARSFDAAKAEALRIVQAAVLAAAAEWED